MNDADGTDEGVREDELQAFVDSQLDRRRHMAVLAHLGRHPEELARLVQYASQTVELRRQLDVIEAEADDPTTARLQRDLAERLLSGQGGRRPWLSQAAAVALLLGVGWSGHALYRAYIEHRLPALVVEAAQAHQVFGEDTQRPVELAAASRAEMVAWFSRHLGEPVEIPSLHAIGLRLVGGRLLSGDEGPIAQLIYEDRSGHRLTLALSSEPTDVGPELHLVAVEGLTAGYWQDGELAYAVVAETSEQQLVTIASEIGAREPDRVL